MRVGEEALGHAHRQERNAGCLDECLHGIVGLRIGGAFAENDQRLLRRFQHVERALDRIRGRDLRRRGVDHLDQRFLACVGIHHLTEQLGRQIEIDAAGTTGHCGADRAGEADTDVGRMQHAERGLTQRLGDRELIHFLVVALLQVDDLALGRAGDQDHREAVGGGMGQRRKAVEEAGCRHGQTDARLLGEIAGDRCGIAGGLFVAERQHPDPLGLRHAAEVGNRNARHAIDRVEAIELECIDDQMEAIGQFLLGGCVGIDALDYCGHPALPDFSCDCWSLLNWTWCGVVNRRETALT
jgi:hypothetical protein